MARGDVRGPSGPTERETQGPSGPTERETQGQGGRATDLCGTWRATPGDDEVRRRFADPGFDDGSWLELTVPGHWRSAPGFAAVDGPVLHRRRFEAPPPAAGRRAFLVLEGCFYQGDVWLDGSYLGDTEGYFVPHAFDVTELLRARAEHVLAVELACSPRPDPGTSRNLTGAFQDPAWVDPAWNPGGIWRPVRVEETGPVRITALRVCCTDATPERARLRLTAGLDAAEAAEVELRTTVASAAGRAGPDVEDRHRVRVTAGANEVSWLLEVVDPALWWPRALEPGGGPPALVDVEVQVRRDRLTSDTAGRRTGLRQVRMRGWVLEVNGERLFLKGASVGPAAMALAEAPASAVERDVALAQEAGLDLLRVATHISRPELYAAADAAGLLLWQDLPLRGKHARSVKRHALHQAGAAVDLLAHHPSIALWCAHDEPFESSEGLLARGQVLPGWDRAVLDPALSRVLETADGSRPVVASSGVLAGGSDVHVSFGWDHGDERDLPRWLRRFPVLARFVGGFGAQAVSESAAWMEPDRWPELDWDRLVQAGGMEKSTFDHRVPPAAYPTFEAWRAATQQHQATLLRHHVEALRRLKYRPTGGFCQLFLADGRPAVSSSVLDHERVPKAGFAALQAACAPVLVTADRPEPWYRPGAAVSLDVHVVSDLRRPLEACVVHAFLTWTGGSHRWSFAGDVPADAVQRVGDLSFVVPDAPGPLTLDLRLEGGAEARAEYASEVVPVL